MNETHSITFGGRRIEFQLRHSTRKTLGITVRPDASVVVTAPLRADVDAVKRKVRKRAIWIRRQQQFFAGYLPTLPPRRFVSGETHRYLGRQYRLKVVEAAEPDVKLRGKFIWVRTPRPRDSGRVRNLVESWYLAHAKERLARSYEENAVRLGKLLETPPAMQVRRMRNRWGSWTRRSGVWLNPELVKTPASCIDYVVTHELCHAVHGNHGKKFYELLRRLMPDWERRKARLERVANG